MLDINYIEKWKKSNIDISKWVHPISCKLEKINNNARGRLFEDYVSDLMVQTFPSIHYCSSRDIQGSMSDGQPDVAFCLNDQSRQKYIEVKSVLEKGQSKNLNYEVTRLKVFDGGEYGQPNFDYLVIAYIHPSRGIIYRSMTQKECRRAINKDIFKYRKEWKGYSFRINDFVNFQHTSLNMYKGLGAIESGEYRKEEIR